MPCYQVDAKWTSHEHILGILVPQWAFSRTVSDEKLGEVWGLGYGQLPAVDALWSGHAALWSVHAALWSVHRALWHCGQCMQHCGQCMQHCGQCIQYCGQFIQHCGQHCVS